MGSSNRGSVITLHASRFTLCLLLSLLFSCDGSETSAPEAQAAPGLAQARLGQDGALQVAIAMVPDGPGVDPRAINDLRGKDLFAVLNEQGVRMAAGQPGGLEVASTNPSWFYRFPATRYLRDDSSALYPLIADPQNEVNDAWANYAFLSDQWLGFAHRAAPSGQSVTFRRDGIKGSVEMRQEGSLYRVNVNGQGWTTVASDLPPPNVLSVHFTVILPLGRARGVATGLANELVPEYAGLWTVDASPRLILEDREDTATPFTFDLRALHMTVDSASYREDLVVPETPEQPEQRFCQGATYQVSAQVLRGNPDYDYWNTGALGWKAEVISPSNEVIRTMYDIAGPALGGTTFEVNWDGKTDREVAARGGIKYGLRMRGILRENIDPGEPAENSAGRLKTLSLAEGPADADLPPFGELRVTPNPYIVYEYTFDENDYAVWPDDDGDGVPDRFPDDDGDGVPDYEAGTVVPIEIYAPLNRKGYDTTWSVEVFAEDGTTRLHDPWTGVGDIAISWADPPQDLEPQEFTYKVTASTCRAPVALEVRAQEVAGCVASTPSATQQYGSEAKLEILDGTGSDVLGFGVDPSTEKDTTKAKRIELLKKVHLYGPAAGGKEIRIKASGLTLSEDLPQITASLESLVSKQSKPGLILKRQKKGEYLSDPIELKNDFILIENSGSSSKPGSRISIGEVYSPSGLMLGLLDEFIGTVQNLGQNSRSPRVLVGSFQEFAFDDTWPLPQQENRLLDPVLSEAAPTVANLQTLGFEPVKCNLTDTGGPELSAVFKVPHPAQTVAWNFHGAHDGSLVLSQEFDERGGPQLGLEFLPSQFIRHSGLKTLIFPSCEALDLNDYNNRVEQPMLSGGWAPAALRIYGGKNWDNATGNGSTILLGYTGDIAKNSVDSVILTYADELNRLDGAAGIADTELEAMAWMSANEAYASAFTSDDDLALLNFQASAITSTAYYYFAFEYNPKYQTLKTPIPSPPDLGHVVYRVPRSKWYSTQPEDWKHNRDSIAQAVTIP